MDPSKALHSLSTIEEILANVEVVIVEGIKDAPSNSKLKRQLKSIQESQQIIMGEQSEIKGISENKGVFNSSLFEIIRHQSSSYKGEVTINFKGIEIATYFDVIDSDENGNFRGHSDKYWHSIAKKLFYDGDQINNIPALNQINS